MYREQGSAQKAFCFRVGCTTGAFSAFFALQSEQTDVINYNDRLWKKNWECKTLFHPEGEGHDDDDDDADHHDHHDHDHDHDAHNDNQDIDNRSPSKKALGKLFQQMIAEYQIDIKKYIPFSEYINAYLYQHIEGSSYYNRQRYKKTTASRESPRYEWCRHCSSSWR